MGCQSAILLRDSGVLRTRASAAYGCQGHDDALGAFCLKCSNTLRAKIKCGAKIKRTRFQRPLQMKKKTPQRVDRANRSVL